MILTDGVPTATATVLRNAAFGDDPGRWPLPAAGTPDELWLRAVVAGGQGRYAGAYADLARVRRVHRVGPLASLAHSTQASFLRQLGWHDRARGWDGRALAVAGTDLEGRVDALIGLAADALGVGRFAASAEALRRAQGLLTAGPRGCRCGWRGCRPSWRWRRATARRRSLTPSGRSSWRPFWARRATR